MKKGLQETTLGEICDRVGGIIQTGPFGSQLHESDYSPEGIPVVMPKDIIEGRISTESVARISPEHVERLSRHALEAGDIVYGRRGDIGRQALIRKEQKGWLCGTGCLRVSLGESVVSPLFLHYYLREKDVITWIANQAVGATMPNLNTAILRSVPIHLPPLPTQHKLAAILSAYDDLIENNEKRIKILEEMAQNLYREWFVKFRFPGHAKVKMVESPIGKIPQGWGVSTIGELAEYLNRGVSPKYDNASSQIVINQKCIRNGCLSLAESRKHSTSVPVGKMIQYGDVLVNSTGVGTLGRVAQVYVDISDCTVDSHVTIVRPSPTKTNMDYFGLSLLNLKSMFERMGAGATGQTELARQRIGESVLLSPSISLQTIFSEAVKPIRSLTVRLCKKNDHLRQTRNLLLPKLISGEVDVSELDIKLPENAA